MLIPPIFILSRNSCKLYNKFFFFIRYTPCKFHLHFVFHFGKINTRYEFLPLVQTHIIELHLQSLQLLQSQSKSIIACLCLHENLHLSNLPLMIMSDASDVTFTFDLYLIYCCQFPVIIAKYTNVCMIKLPTGSGKGILQLMPL